MIKLKNCWVSVKQQSLTHSKSFLPTHHKRISIFFQGMKVACTHFQCAAWAFEFLRDHFGSSNLSVDMSHEVLTFQVNLMLVSMKLWYLTWGSQIQGQYNACKYRALICHMSLTFQVNIMLVIKYRTFICLMRSSHSRSI